MTLINAVNAVKAGKASLEASLLRRAVDQPSPEAPPGVTDNVNTILNWLFWGLCIAGVVGIIVAGILMAISNRRGEGQEHVQRLGYVVAGLILGAAATGIVNLLMGA